MALKGGFYGEIAAGSPLAGQQILTNMVAPFFQQQIATETETGFKIQVQDVNSFNVNGAVEISVDPVEQLTANVPFGTVALSFTKKNGVAEAGTYYLNQFNWMYIMADSLSGTATLYVSGPNPLSGKSFQSFLLDHTLQEVIDLINEE